MSIVDRVAKLAKENNMTIKKLEQELGFGNGTIRKWDTNSPGSDKLLKLASFLHVSCDYILTGKKAESGKTIRQDEDYLLELYNRLSDFNKGKIIGYAEGLSDSTVESAALEKKNHCYSYGVMTGNSK